MLTDGHMGGPPRTVKRTPTKILRLSVKPSPMKAEAFQKGAQEAIERPEVGAQPCLDMMPYRTIVFARFHSSESKTPLYWVAGAAGGPWAARNSLKKAVETHGAKCFYCPTKLSKDNLTIDHVEGKKGDAAEAIQNLVAACKPCNAKKGHQPIDAFHPEAGREWLRALHAQVEERLRKLG